MARLRTSLTSAIKSATNDINKNHTSLEMAAHKASLKYNEKENEILNKLIANKTKIERQGKVGRPKKAQSVASSSENDKKENIILKNYVYFGPVLINQNGKEFLLNIEYSTKTNKLEKAKDEILNFMFKNEILCYISEKDFEKYLKNE